jgi:hypothetical protein
MNAARWLVLAASAALSAACHPSHSAGEQPAASQSAAWPAAPAPPAASGAPDDVVERRPLPVVVVAPAGAPPFRTLDGYVVTDRRGKSAAVLQLLLSTATEPELHQPIDALLRSAIDQLAAALHTDSGEAPEIHVYVYDSEERARRSTFDALAWCGFEPDEYREIECSNHIPMTFADRVSGAVAKLWRPETGLPESQFDATHHTVAVNFRYVRAPNFVTAVDDCLARSLTLYQQLRDLTALTYTATWMGKRVVFVRFADRDQFDALDFPGVRARLGNPSASPTDEARREYANALAKLPRGSVVISLR